MPDQEAKLRLIIAYLYRNVQELIEAKKTFFQKLNLGEDNSINKIMFDLIRRAAPYYLEYLENKSTMERLEKYLKREIRIIIVSLRSKLGLNDFLNKGKDSEEKLKKLVDNWFSYIHPTFIPFEGKDDLISIFDGAEKLAVEYRIRLEMVFINDNNYNVLLRRLYEDRDEIKKYFENYSHPLKKILIRKKSEMSLKKLLTTGLEKFTNPPPLVNMAFRLPGTLFYSISTTYIKVNLLK